MSSGPTAKDGTSQKIWDVHLPPIPPDSELEGVLNTLAEVLLILDIPDLSFASYSTAITRMDTRKFELSRSINHLTQVETELNEHLEALKHEYGLLKHWKNSLSPDSSNSIYSENTIALERRKENLVRKAKEYHRELEALLRDQPLKIPVSVSQYLTQKEKNVQLEKSLKEKRAKVKAFQGLPPNLELARHELRLARQRQHELIELRERLLGKMADSVV